jgi:hypothetical protein
MELHAVIIRKPITLEKAREIASEYINNKKRNYYRETNTSYRFRNIPKQKFKSFRSKKINKVVTLIYGSGFAERGNVGGGITGSGFFDSIKDKIENFILRYNPFSLIGKALIGGAKDDLREKGYFQKSNRLPY